MKTIIVREGIDKIEHSDFLAADLVYLIHLDGAIEILKIETVLIE